MSHRTDPVVGEWYSRRDSGDILEVVYIDLDNAVVDVQDESGKLAEINLADWYAAAFKIIEPPRDVYEELNDTAVLNILDPILAEKAENQSATETTPASQSVAIAA